MHHEFADDIEVKKHDLPKAAKGQTINYRGTEYLVVGSGGFGFWSYWILRPVKAQPVDTPRQAADSPLPAPALAATFYTATPPLQSITTTEPEPEIPPSFAQAMKEFEAGKVFNLDDVLSEKPPPAPDPEPPREPEPFTPVIIENPDPVPNAAPEPSADKGPDVSIPDTPPADAPCFDAPSNPDNSNVC